MTTGSVLEGVKVLVVEDEFVIAYDLELSLRALGCDVLGPVPDCAAALKLVEHTRPDVAVLDLHLLAGDAGPVARALSEVGVPFMMVTGTSGEATTDPVLQAAPHFTKPFNAGQLEGALWNLVSPEQQG